MEQEHKLVNGLNPVRTRRCQKLPELVSSEFCSTEREREEFPSMMAMTLHKSEKERAHTLFSEKAPTDSSLS